MQLIIILLSTVSILTFLSGLITFFGAKRGDRVKSAWFFAAAFFAPIWMISISPTKRLQLIGIRNGFLLVQYLLIFPFWAMLRGMRGMVKF